MEIVDRMGYALLGLVFGAILGAGGWWLYGLVHSLRYDGPGIDPVLFDWLKYGAATFGVVGFVLRGRLGDAIGVVFGAVAHFEGDVEPNERRSSWVTVLIVGMLLVAIWFTYYR